MAIRVVRLGSERAKNEGARIGTVRRPPRGVPKSKFASQNWYDVWFPNLAPSLDTVKQGLVTVSTHLRHNARAPISPFEKGGLRGICFCFGSNSSPTLLFQRREKKQGGARRNVCGQRSN